MHACLPGVIWGLTKQPFVTCHILDLLETQQATEACNALPAVWLLSLSADPREREQ